MTIFSKQQYEKIAKCLRDELKYGKVSPDHDGRPYIWAVALSLADMLTEDNPRFKRPEFLEACTPED